MVTVYPARNSSGRPLLAGVRHPYILRMVALPMMRRNQSMPNEPARRAPPMTTSPVDRRSHWARVLVVALPLLLSRALPAQTPSGVVTGPDTGVLVRAEAEGAKLSRVAPPDTPGAMFGRVVVGTSERRCVEADGVGGVRSGEFVTAGAGGQGGMVAGRAFKFAWSPLHASGAMPALVVTGRNLAVPADTFVYSSHSIGVTGSPPNQGYLFPSGIAVSNAGRWALIAVSGSNWGCFVVTVRP